MIIGLLQARPQEFAVAWATRIFAGSKEKEVFGSARSVVDL